MCKPLACLLICLIPNNCMKEIVVVKQACESRPFTTPTYGTIPEWSKYRRPKEPWRSTIAFWEDLGVRSGPNPHFKWSNNSSLTVFTTIHSLLTPNLYHWPRLFSCPADTGHLRCLKGPQSTFQMKFQILLL